MKHEQSVDRYRAAMSGVIAEVAEATRAAQIGTRWSWRRLRRVPVHDLDLYVREILWRHRARRARATEPGGS